MARSRNIKPGFFTNEKLAELSPLARLLFAGLWCECDREGRLEDRPKRIKVAVLPYDDCDPEKLLNELARAGFIIRYVVEENKYIQVVNFSKHQNPHVKESASTIPAPDKPGSSTVQAPEIPERAGLIPDSLLLIPDSLDCKQSARKRASQFPEDFKPNESHQAMAAQFAVNLDSEFLAFSDYHRSKGTTFKDWNLALNTWLRNSKKFSAKSRFETLEEKRLRQRAETLAYINKDSTNAPQ